MSAVIEKFVGIETVLGRQGARHEAGPETGRSLHAAVTARLPLRQAKQRWCTSLCDQDLQALLQIIESDLLPQLLNGYSPARHAPVERLVSG